MKKETTAEAECVASNALLSTLDRRLRMATDLCYAEIRAGVPASLSLDLLRKEEELNELAHRILGK